jgi:hypothetical protein
MPSKGVQKTRGKGTGYGAEKDVPQTTSRTEGTGQMVAEPKQAAAPKRTERKPAPTHEQIAERAKAIWQQRGSPVGQDERIWYEAEAQLKDESGIT